MSTVHKQTSPVSSGRSPTFNQTNQLRVCTQLVHDQALAADPAVAIIGPFAAADAGTEVRRLRRCAYVPPKYIGLFLEQDLTPREACERGCAAIEHDGLDADLDDLCFWLRAAMTCQVAGANSPLVIDHPLAPVANHLLSSHRRQLLFLNLPALSSTSVGQGAQLIAGAVGNLMDQQGQFHQVDIAHRAEKVKTPATLLGSSVNTLLRLSQVDTIAELGPVWWEMALETKTQQRNVLQQAVDVAMGICLPGVLRTHVVTPSLAKKLLTLEFRMTNPDDLSTGIQPFIMVQTTAAQRQQAQDLVHVYEAVMGGATATVADAQFLVANDPA